MSQFKPLSLGSLPRVFINILATYADEPEALANLPKIFAAVLSVPKDERQKFVRPFNRFLDLLGEQDAWGTEGQCDPRGDRRLDSSY